MKKTVFVLSVIGSISGCVTTQETSTQTETPSVNQATKATTVESVVKKAEIATPLVKGAYSVIVCRYNGNVVKMNRSSADTAFDLFGGGYKNFQYNLFMGDQSNANLIGYSQSQNTIIDKKTPTCQVFNSSANKVTLYAATRNMANFYSLQGGTAEVSLTLEESVPGLVFLGTAGTSGFGYKWAMEKFDLSNEIYKNCSDNEYKDILYADSPKSQKKVAIEGLNQFVKSNSNSSKDFIACNASAIAVSAKKPSSKQVKWGVKNASKILSRRY